MISLFEQTIENFLSVGPHAVAVLLVGLFPVFDLMFLGTVDGYLALAAGEVGFLRTNLAFRHICLTIINNNYFQYN